MVRTDEDALACDMAETYGVLDWRALPLGTAATLAGGLPDSARVRLAAAGARADTQTLLLAMLADTARVIQWMLSEDGQKGRNRPQSVLRKITGSDEDARGYTSPAAFEAALRRARGG